MGYLSSWTLPGGEEEPGDFCEQAPEQDQPGGDRVGVPVLGWGESIIINWPNDASLKTSGECININIDTLTKFVKPTTFNHTT